MDLIVKNSEAYIRTLKSTIRSIKIRVALGETIFTVRRTNVTPKYLRALTKASLFGVVCGSGVLRLHGLISRHPKDIDLLVTQETLNRLESVYTMHKYRYSTILNSASNLRGTISIDGYFVDLFVVDELEYVEREGLRLSHVSSVLDKKLMFIKERLRLKDLDDIAEVTKAVKDNTFHHSNPRKSIFSYFFHELKRSISNLIGKLDPY